MHEHNFKSHPGQQSPAQRESEQPIFAEFQIFRTGTQSEQGCSYSSAMSLGVSSRSRSTIAERAGATTMRGMSLGGCH